MSVQVRIPAPLRRITGGQDKIEAEGTTLNEILSHLEDQFPGIKARLCDDQGELRQFVNIYVNGEDIRFLDKLNTPMASGDEISIVPAVAGG